MKTVTGYFNFFPVGQGLFYGGNISLDDRSLFTFIYDCGTEKGWGSYLDNAIKSFKTFDKCEIRKLDLIVISHLHIDHFLGVYKLINRFGKPRKIILPLIEGDKFEIELTLFSVFNANGNVSFNKEAFAFFNDLYLGAKNQERDLDSFIIEEERYDFTTIDSYMLKQNNKRLPLVYNNQKIWEFDFIRGSIGRKNNAVISLIHKNVLNLVKSAGCSTIEDYIMKDIDALEKIKDIYTNAGFKNSSSMNNISTIMMHYPISPFCDHFYPRFYPCVEERVATLLTGDSNINKSQAKIICDLLDKIEPCFLITQLPHHGSNYNFKSLAKYLWTYIVNGVCIVSFGIGNSYGHPGNISLHSFAFNQLIKVNEYKNYSYRIMADYP